jgi:hypothetical protein
MTPQATQQNDELWFPKACVFIVRYHENFFLQWQLMGNGQCCDVNRTLRRLQQTAEL